MEINSKQQEPYEFNLAKRKKGGCNLLFIAPELVLEDVQLMSQVLKD